MEVVGDVVAAARERDGPLFAAPDRSADYAADEFATTAWKVGNLLRHYGVRPGTRAAVAIGPKRPGPDDEPGRLGPEPTPILAVLGAALDGAVVDLDPPGAVDATVLIAPDDWWDRYETGPGTNRIAYGGPPDEAAVAHLEGEAWSENPLEPPGEVGPDDPVFDADGGYDHGDVVAASGRVVEEHDLTAGDRVAIAAPIAYPGAFAAGVLAPMRAGATVVLGDADDADPEPTAVVIDREDPAAAAATAGVGADRSTATIPVGDVL